MWKGVTICELLHFKCTCGNCSCKLVTNISEWYCCKEIEGCCGVLTNEIVWNDLEEGEELHCISKHLGLRPVCLKKGSLSLVSGKYRTRVKQAYKKKLDQRKGTVDFFFKLSKFAFNPSWISPKIPMKSARKKGTSSFYLRKGITSKVNDLFVRKHASSLFPCLRLWTISDVWFKDVTMDIL